MTTKATTRRLAPPTATSPKPFELVLAVRDPKLAKQVEHMGATLGMAVRASPSGRALPPLVDDRLSTVLRSLVLVGVDGSIGRMPEVSARAAEILGGYVSEAGPHSRALLREEADGRLTLALPGTLPIDLGEPHDALAAFERARRPPPHEVDIVRITPREEERARGILFGPRRRLSDPSSRRALEAVGIGCGPYRASNAPAHAAAQARKIGLPVDLCLASPDVSALDDPGLVLRDARTALEVRDGYRALVRRARQAAPSARILGATVMPHAKPHPSLRLRIEGGANFELGLDDEVGATLVDSLSIELPRDSAGFRRALAAFAGRRALPREDHDEGGALLALLVRLSYVARLLSDEVASIELGGLHPIILAEDGKPRARWLPTAVRVSVRGTEGEEAIAPRVPSASDKAGRTSAKKRPKAIGTSKDGGAGSDPS